MKKKNYYWIILSIIKFKRSYSSFFHKKKTRIILQTLKFKRSYLFFSQEKKKKYLRRD